MSVVRWKEPCWLWLVCFATTRHVLWRSQSSEPAAGIENHSSSQPLVGKPRSAAAPLLPHALFCLFPFSRAFSASSMLLCEYCNSTVYTTLYSFLLHTFCIQEDYTHTQCHWSPTDSAGNIKLLLLKELYVKNTTAVQCPWGAHWKGFTIPKHMSYEKIPKLLLRGCQKMFQPIDLTGSLVLENHCTWRYSLQIMLKLYFFHLHGSITKHAYCIPFAFVRFQNRAAYTTTTQCYHNILWKECIVPCIQSCRRNIGTYLSPLTIYSIFTFVAYSCENSVSYHAWKNFMMETYNIEH